MERAKLTDSSVVLTKNDKIGVVVSFNGNPSHIVFASFTNPISSWDENLVHSNDNYTIVEVRDGSSLSSALEAFKKRVYCTLEVVK